MMDELIFFFNEYKLIILLLYSFHSLLFSLLVNHTFADMHEKVRIKERNDG